MNQKAIRLKVKAHCPAISVEKPHGKQKAEPLPYNSGQCSTHCTHMECHNKYNIQNQVCDGGYCNEQQRMMTISHSTENGTNCVITIDKNQTDKANENILLCIDLRFRGYIQQPQKPIGQ